MCLELPADQVVFALPDVQRCRGSIGEVEVAPRVRSAVDRIQDSDGYDVGAGIRDWPSFPTERAHGCCEGFRGHSVRLLDGALRFTALVASSARNEG